ncbi:MAG TPA: hypothetical protein ENK33_07080 [Desulfobacterales bacterium]|nr:hypothetical protein [Desulfobacterales bacterium]
MPENKLPPFITGLLQPNGYPHTAADIQLVQTHISYVLLAGDFVYKIKKPVDFGFLDFTTLDKRRHFCAEELRLNRRLCPDLYLQTMTINEENGLFNLKGQGRVVEHCLQMRRMPEDKMMSRIIEAGALSKSMLDNIVELLSDFYQRAEGGEKINKFGSAQAVAVNVLENFEQTASFIGCPSLSQAQFDTITVYARNFLACQDKFQKRVAAGKIRDCHGDLYSANICLADKTYIYDCIEFNERFRYCDVASDVAFLCMDLDFHGLNSLADYFIQAFIDKSHDPELREMLNFYKCYRAYVRGKIGLFTAHAPEVDAATRDKSFQQAGKYFQLAERYAQAG